MFVDSAGVGGGSSFLLCVILTTILYNNVLHSVELALGFGK